MTSANVTQKIKQDTTPTAEEPFKHKKAKHKSQIEISFKNNIPKNQRVNMCAGSSTHDALHSRDAQLNAMSITISDMSNDHGMFQFQCSPYTI